ncbi:MAG TPA: AAA family ATPase [Myxococcota bacterium]|nr:AAA family ATPase [Myxococcota bacterium]
MSGFEPAPVVKAIREELGRAVVGQTELVDGLLLGLLTGGHVLVEGVPGLAKTTAVRSLAQVLGLGFRRIQFTPDLLPGDLIGTPVYVPAEQRFEVRRGPVFAPVLLADEINRAPAKVQSALLEAMEERQVTIGEETLALPEPFLVMATQNPIDLEGTYPLPEAQVDRFLLKVLVSYPSLEEEREIVARDAGPRSALRPVTGPEQVRALQQAAAEVHVAPALADYAVRIARATRDRAGGGPLPAATLSIGASPRASLFLVRAARARALLDGRTFATPHDVKRVAPAVLRHRLLLSYEAEADGVTADAVIDGLLGSLETP